MRGRASPRSSCSCSLLDSLLSDLRTHQPITGRQTDFQPMRERACQTQIQLRLLTTRLAALLPVTDQPIRGRQIDFQPMRERVCQPQVKLCLLTTQLAALRPETGQPMRGQQTDFQPMREGLDSPRSSCACSLLDSLLSDLRQVSQSEGDKQIFSQ